MEREFRKRLGRFIKKSDDILNVVAMRKFSFEAICEHELVNYDNPNSNLILSRYHEPHELKKTVLNHKKFDLELRDVDSIAPILKPIDFTADWRRQQERASKRNRQKVDEDEEYELELEHTMQQLSQVAGQEHDSDGDLPEDEKPVHEAAIAQLSDLESVDEKSHLENLSKENDAVEAKSDPNDQSNENNQIERAPKIVMQQESSQTSAPASIQSPENEAMREYRESLSKEEHQSAAANDPSEVSRGYEEGFQKGKQEASQELNSISQKVVDSLGGILTELSQLRTKLVEGAQHNFLEICQALSEAIIGRELATDPKAFVDIINKAVSEGFADDQFKIAVHPQFAQILQKIDLGSLKNKIYEDPDVTPGDFRIEGKDSVVDGNIKQMIAELLKKVDLNIFEDAAKKAS